MSPPIHKEWWLAAALSSATLPAALAQPAPADRVQSGVVTSVTLPGARAVTTPLFIDGTKDQRLVTGPNESLHMLFSDQSAITVGPNSQLVIADYRFDKETRDGRLVVQMTRGFLRVVGGFLSKKRSTLVHTATATIGVRGGISLIEDKGDGVSGTFLFGEEMQFTSPDGQNSETVNRPGFGIDAGPGGITAPYRVAPEQLSARLAGLEGSVPPPQVPPPAQTDPQADNSVRDIAPDRVLRRTGTETGIVPPKLADILGSQAPGNQS